MLNSNALFFNHSNMKLVYWLNQNLHSPYVVLEMFSVITCTFSILSTENSCACRINISGSHIVFCHKATLFVGHLVQCALKEFSHEGQAVLLDVGLPSKGVEDGIGTAADEGQSRGHCTTGLRDMIQSAEKQNILDNSFTLNVLYVIFQVCKQ